MGRSHSLVLLNSSLVAWRGSCHWTGPEGNRPVTSEKSTALTPGLALHWETIALSESYSQRIAAPPSRALGWFQSQ